MRATCDRGARARGAQGQARTELFRAILERFRAMIDAGQLSVYVARSRMVLTLPESVLFDTGRAELKAGGRHVLVRVAAVLRELRRDFQVAGHTDNVPIHNDQFTSNWELSTARAVTVVHLLAEQRMLEGRLSAAGYADARAVDANLTAGGRQLSRCIELVLQPAFDELPDLSALRDLANAPAHARRVARLAHAHRPDASPVAHALRTHSRPALRATSENRLERERCHDRE